MNKKEQKLFFITQDNRVFLTTDETSFEKEKDLQVLVEGNLMNLLGLHFVKNEHSLKNMRFDTLGLTREGRPAIIEYITKGTGTKMFCDKSCPMCACLKITRLTSSICS